MPWRMNLHPLSGSAFHSYRREGQGVGAFTLVSPALPGAHDQPIALVLAKRGRHPVRKPLAQT